MLSKIYIYHTNDLHSHFENWPKVTHYLKKAKKSHIAKGEDFLLFDIGDHIDRANPISEATMGKGNVALLEEIQYNAITIGNNEGITLPKESLDTLYIHSNADILIANLFHENGERPSWVKPYRIYTLQHGIKVGVIGITVPYVKFYELLGWSIRDPFTILEQLVQEVKQQADVVILLSHLGINDDEKIANEINGIDIILGGHTHHLFENGKEINGVTLGAADKYGRYVGKLEITIDLKQKNIIEKNAQAFSLMNEVECLETQELLKQITAESNPILNQKVTCLKEAFSVNWFDESELPQLLARALKEWCDAEISMLNAGVLLESLPEGIVTRGDLHRICPHPINPCKVYLKGDQLKEIIHQSFSDKMQQLKLKGLGFRGEVMGRMVFDGVEVQVKRLADQLNHVTDIKVLGEAIDPEREYSIATLDMFTFGYLYPEISHARVKQYFMPEMLRDVLLWKLNAIVT